MLAALLIAACSNSPQMAAQTSAQSRQSIFKGSGQLFATSSVVTVSDSHGTWFGTDQGIYLYTGTVLMKVSNQAGYPGNGCF